MESGLDPKRIDQFEAEVVPLLKGLLRRVRLYVFAEGLAYTSMAAVLCFTLQLAIDYAFRLRVDLRAGLLLAILLLLGMLSWRRLVRPFLVRITLEDAAAVVERKFPALQSALISAVQFASGRVDPVGTKSPHLVGRVIERAVQAVGDLPTGQVLHHSRARIHSALVCVVLLGMVSFTWLAPETVGTWFERNILLGSAAWRQQTYLIVLNDEDGDGVIYAPRGDDLEVRVQAQGKRPRQVSIDLYFASRKRQSHAMTAVGRDGYRFTVARLAEGLSFHVRGGDARNDDIRVELVDRPRIVEATVTIYPPAYTREPSRALRTGKSLIELLHGSEIEIRFKTNKALRRAVLLEGENEISEVAEVGGVFAARFFPQRNATYTFQLVDQNELINKRPRQFLVRLRQDAPPTVSVKIDSAGDLVTPQAVLRVDLSAKDRYGLGGGVLICDLTGDPVRGSRIELAEIVEGSREATFSRTLVLASLGAEEGRQLLLRTEVSDLNDVTGPGVGLSSKYTLRIVSTEELLAELARKEQEYGQEFERLIEIQEKVRNDLLSAAGMVQHRTSRPPAINLVSLKRRQRQLARQVTHVGTQFQRIYDELVINRLGSDQVERRLLNDIARPLQVLADTTIAEAADLMDRLSKNASPVEFVVIDRLQEQGLVEMRRILDNIAKWEGFHETITLLQTIIKMQRNLRKETDDTLGGQLDDIFENN